MKAIITAPIPSVIYFFRLYCSFVAKPATPAPASATGTTAHSPQKFSRTILNDNGYFCTGVKRRDLKNKLSMTIKMSNRFSDKNLRGQNYVDTASSYARLGSYTSGFRGIRPPVPTTTVSGYYVVPAYSAPGYDTLTHGQVGCAGGYASSGGPYFSIGRAYGYGAGNCNTQYMGSMCQ